MCPASCILPCSRPCNNVGAGNQGKMLPIVFDHQIKVNPMRKYALVALLALAAPLVLAGCSNNDQSADDAAQQQQTQTAKVTRPTDPNDSAAWGKYLQQVLSQHLQGMTADRPYPYMVPGGDSDDAKSRRQRQLDSVTGVVQRGVTPGNLLAFG